MNDIVLNELDADHSILYFVIDCPPLFNGGVIYTRTAVPEILLIKTLTGEPGN